MYIAKAFVEVSSVEKMRDLYLDIKRFYGRPCDNLLYSPNGNVVVFNETEVWSMFSKYPNAEHFIDCNFYANGDEERAIELFLELAKMGDECYKGQWIWQQCNETGEITNLHKSNGKYVMYCFKYAEPLDVAEAFKQGKINLK